MHFDLCDLRTWTRQGQEKKNQLAQYVWQRSYRSNWLLYLNHAQKWLITKNVTCLLNINQSINQSMFSTRMWSGTDVLYTVGWKSSYANKRWYRMTVRHSVGHDGSSTCEYNLLESSPPSWWLRYSGRCIRCTALNHHNLSLSTSCWSTSHTYCAVVLSQRHITHKQHAHRRRQKIDVKRCLRFFYFLATFSAFVTFLNNFLNVFIIKTLV